MDNFVEKAIAICRLTSSDDICHRTIKQELKEFLKEYDKQQEIERQLHPIWK